MASLVTSLSLEDDADSNIASSSLLADSDTDMDRILATPTIIDNDNDSHNDHNSDSNIMNITSSTTTTANYWCYQPAKMTPLRSTILSIVFAIFALGAGYKAGIQPAGDWRYFSWHPFFMTCGMIGLSAIGAVTKKLGGYTSTKLHGIISWAGLMSSMAGMYVIYRNKEMYGKKHLHTTHAIVGFCLMLSCIGVGMVGGIVLHPDFGFDKTNKTIRFYHKIAARIILILAWVNAFIGLQQMNVKHDVLLLFGIPLLIFIPLALV